MSLRVIIVAEINFSISFNKKLFFFQFVHKGYRSDTASVGKSVGRVCNRIGFGKFDIDGEHFEVDKNFNNTHQLHGGSIGFSKFNWQAYKSDTKVVMTHVNPDGFQGE